MKLREWYMLARDDDSGAVRIDIYDEIGEGWFGGGVSAKQFMTDFRTIGRSEDIDVHMSTPGGVTNDAKVMFNALSNHQGNVRIFVDGLAASCGSYIAMAGNEIIMADNAMMMIHEPWGMAIGDAATMQDTADLLNKESGVLARAYSERSGLADDEMFAIMKSETWYTGDEAVAAGFADSVAPPIKLAACYNLSQYPFKRLPHQFAASMSVETTMSRQPEAAPDAPPPMAAGPGAVEPVVDDAPDTVLEAASADEPEYIDMVSRSQEIGRLFSMAGINDVQMFNTLLTDTQLSIDDCAGKIQEAQAAMSAALHVDNVPAADVNPVIEMAERRRKEDEDRRSKIRGI